MARYPQAWSFAPCSCRPLSLHWLLVTLSQILSIDLVYPLRPTPPTQNTALLSVQVTTPEHKSLNSTLPPICKNVRLKSGS